MIATSARTSVRFSPCSLGESLADCIQFDGQPAKEECELLPGGLGVPVHRHLRPSRRRAILSTIEIFDHQGKSCLAAASLRWLAPGHHRAGLARPRRPPRRAGRQADQVQENDSAAFLPDSAESTRVTELLEASAPSRALPVILLWEGDGRPRRAAARRDRRPGRGGRGARRGRRRAGGRRPPRRSRPRTARPPRRSCRSTPTSATTLPELIAELRALDGVDGTTFHVTGPGATFSDFAERLLRHRRPAAARRVRRRPADPAGRLPQPAPAAAGHRHRRAGALGRPPRSPTCSRAGLDRGQRAEPGHRVDPRRRRGHRLRPAPGRPLPRGTAPRAVEVRGDAASPCGSRGSRSSPPAPR